MQEFDFTQGGYIIPTFVDSLDVYSTKIVGYRPARIGQPSVQIRYGALVLRLTSPAPRDRAGSAAAPERQLQAPALHPRCGSVSQAIPV